MIAVYESLALPAEVILPLGRLHWGTRRCRAAVAPVIPAVWALATPAVHRNSIRPSQQLQTLVVAFPRRVR